MYHVTRQSFGVGKLYCKNDLEKKYQEILIYIANFLFFIIGYFRFYLPLIDENKEISDIANPLFIEQKNILNNKKILLRIDVLEYYIVCFYLNYTIHMMLLKNKLIGKK